MAPVPPSPDRVEERPTLEELRALRERLPPTIQFGTSGYEYPGWAGIVWHGERSAADLARDGLIEYAAHPLLSTMYLESGVDAHASERDLRLYAGQLPDALHCVLQVHPEVTTPRFLRSADRAWSGGRAGQANPHFLDSRFFLTEILSTYQDVFGERLGPFLFTFPPTLARAGVSPEAFADRLDRFLSSLPEETACAVEVRDPDYLTLPYARTLARYEVSHVYTTWPGMPSFLDQAAAVPTSPELIVQIVEPTGDRAARAIELEPFDRIRYPDAKMRDGVVALLRAMRGVPTYVLVQNEAEGCAPLTIVALARMLADEL